MAKLVLLICLLASLICAQCLRIRRGGVTQPPATTTPITTMSPDTVMSSFVGQFEDALDESQSSYLAERSNAQGNATIHLNSANSVGVEIRLKICIVPLSEKPVLFRAEVLDYSNDGDSDTINLALNNMMSVTATTVGGSRGGAGWNDFKKFEFPTKYAPLQAGNHSVVITVQTDQYGVELDALSFMVINHNPEFNLLCGAKLVVPMR